MGKMITVITATGDRHLTFELSQRWMENQTVKPDEWIVIDDGSECVRLTYKGNVRHVIRKKQEDEPKFTMLLNLEEAIKNINGDKIIIWEDDEYYAPNYIEVMSKKLDEFELVGIGESKYYHITGKYFRHVNKEKSSLAQTSFRNSLLPQFTKILDFCKQTGNMYLDMKLWKANITVSKHIFFDNEASLYCGIKGMEGRKGIGWAHEEKLYRMSEDVNNEVLKQWVPNDYLEYLKIRESINNV